jgi:hypothetical protein
MAGGTDLAGLYPIGSRLAGDVETEQAEDLAHRTLK